MTTKNKTRLPLTYIPNYFRDFKTNEVTIFWKLYCQGVRFTPDALTNEEVMQVERNARLAADCNITYRYWYDW